MLGFFVPLDGKAEMTTRDSRNSKDFNAADHRAEQPPEQGQERWMICPMCLRGIWESQPAPNSSELRTGCCSIDGTELIEVIPADRERVLEQQRDQWQEEAELAEAAIAEHQRIAETDLASMLEEDEEIDDVGMSTSVLEARNDRKLWAALEAAQQGGADA